MTKRERANLCAVGQMIDQAERILRDLIPADREIHEIRVALIQQQRKIERKAAGPVTEQ